MLAFSTSEVCDVPEIETQINAKYIQGVYQKEGDLTVLLDVAKVLDIADVKLVQKAA